MIQVKLQKISSGKKLLYYIVVKDRYKAVSSGFLEKIGLYTPHADKLNNKYVFLDYDRFSHWVANGASINPDLYKLIKDLHFYEN